MENVKLTINGKEITAPAGSTILEAARQNGIYIPTLCYDEAVEVYGACGLCVVEAEGIPKLLRSCSAKVSDGMVINTESERVIKSRNISDDGKEIIDIPGYDSYIKKDTVENLSAYKFVGNQNVYLTPNMTYKPRVMRNTGNVVVNGSVAVLIPKEKMALSERQMEYFSSAEYRKFYQIARNYQTRSLNVDATSVFFYGVLKECCNG